MFCYNSRRTSVLYRSYQAGGAMIPCLQLGQPIQVQDVGLSPCEHRSVSADGRIVCKKIVEGDPEVSPSLCRSCPYKVLNCAHLRFSLRQRSPSPLVVRFNGRTELWDDGPPELCLERAACAARVIPILDPGSCLGCPLRRPVQDGTTHEGRRPQPASRAGKVVPFPTREAVAATG